MELDYIILQECNCFVVHGLDLDIAVQGKTIDDAIASFELTAIIQMAAYTDIDKDPISEIGIAPEEYSTIANDSRSFIKQGVIYLPCIPIELINDASTATK